MIRLLCQDNNLIECCRKWAEQIGLLCGWRRNAAAFGFGVCATLTLAPFFIFTLLFVSFTGLLWLINGAHSRRRAFWDGWWWGWGFFVTSMYWMNIALLMYADHLQWMVPEALFGLTAYLAVYSGLACWLTVALGVRGLNRLIVLSVAWVGMEYLRGSVIAEFPWNLIGYSLGFSDAALQLASVIGIYGLTWFAVFLGSSFAVLGDKTIPVRHGVAFVAIVWMMFAGSIGFGEWRLHWADRIPESDRYVEGVLLRIVQPNISQELKRASKSLNEIYRHELDLTRSAGIESVTDIIWPESAIPHVFEAGEALPTAWFKALPEGPLLITGADRLELHPAIHQLNSLVAISQKRKLIAFYDMHELLPWAEYIPWRWLVPRALLAPVVSRPDVVPGAMRMDYSPGVGPRTLKLPGLPSFAPLICYEVVFPELASIPDHSPQWLLAITNDAWFGQSTGPYQHFEMARLRAIEQGLPMMIAGNVGISASIDSYGRVLASLGLGEKGVLDVELPKPIPGGTIYGRYGEWFVYVVLSGTALLVEGRRVRFRSHGQRRQTVKVATGTAPQSKL